jgi:hypothetical protein
MLVSIVHFRRYKTVIESDSNKRLWGTCANMSHTHATKALHVSDRSFVTPFI